MLSRVKEMETKPRSVTLLFSKESSLIVDEVVVSVAVGDNDWIKTVKAKARLWLSKHLLSIQTVLQ